MSALGNPFMALALLFLVGIALIALLVVGLCVLALFLPVVLVILGIFLLVAGHKVGMPMQARMLVGFGLILIGAAWLFISW